MIKVKAHKDCISKMILKGKTGELMIELVVICIGALISLSDNEAGFEELKEVFYKALENIDYSEARKGFADK